jgi:hypothetical protein
VSPSPQNRARDLHRTRLKQTITLPVTQRPIAPGCCVAFGSVCRPLPVASNLSRQPFTTYSVGCQAGHLIHVSNLSVRSSDLIRPVMSSRCLSAGGLRFLDHPVPAEEFGLPCGRLTG